MNQKRITQKASRFFHRHASTLWYFTLLLANSFCYVFCLNRTVDFSHPTGQFGFGSQTLLYQTDSDIRPSQLSELLPYEDVTILAVPPQGAASVYDPANYFSWQAGAVQPDQYFSKSDYKNGTDIRFRIVRESEDSQAGADSSASQSVLASSLLADEGIEELSSLYADGIQKGSLVYIYSEKERILKDMAAQFENLPVSAMNYETGLPSLKEVIQTCLQSKKSALVLFLMMGLLLLFVGSIMTSVLDHSSYGDFPEPAREPGDPLQPVWQAACGALLVEMVISFLSSQSSGCLYYSLTLLVVWGFAAICTWLMAQLLRTLLSNAVVQKILWILDGMTASLILLAVVLIAEDGCISLASRIPEEVRFILLALFPFCLMALGILCLYLWSRLERLSPSEYRASMALFAQTGLCVLTLACAAAIPVLGAFQALLTGGCSIFLLLLLLLMGTFRQQKQSRKLLS